MQTYLLITDGMATMVLRNLKKYIASQFSFKSEILVNPKHNNY